MIFFETGYIALECMIYMKVDFRAEKYFKFKGL